MVGLWNQSPYQMVTHDELHRGIPHLGGADDEDSPTELFQLIILQLYLVK